MGNGRDFECEHFAHMIIDAYRYSQTAKEPLCLLDSAKVTVLQLLLDSDVDECAMDKMRALLEEAFPIFFGVGRDGEISLEEMLEIQNAVRSEYAHYLASLAEPLAEQLAV